MKNNILTFSIFFFSISVFAQDINLKIKLQISNGLRDEAVWGYTPGHTYMLYQRTNADSFNVSFFSKEDSLKFSIQDSIGIFEIKEIDYDSITIYSKELGVTVYDIPTLLLKNTEWLVVLNERAPPHCIEYTYNSHWSPTRGKPNFTHCGCCRNDNSIYVEFFDKEGRKIHHVDEMWDYMEKYKYPRYLPSPHQSIPYSYDYVENCPYYFDEEFIWKEAEGQSKNEIEKLLENKNWRLLGVSYLRHKKRQFQVDEDVDCFINGSSFLLRKNYFKEDGWYEVEGDSLIVNKFRISYGGIWHSVEVYKIIEIAEDYMITERMVNLYDYEHPPKINIVRTVWEN